MKKLIVLSAMVVSMALAGCAATGLEQLAACGECVQGLQEMQNMQSLIPMINEYIPPVAPQ